MNLQKHIAICGGIAVGKTTLCHNLSNVIPLSQVIEEIPSSNPFLADFYKDPKRWSFHSRIGMLSLFFTNYRTVSKDRPFILFDRCMQELIVFAQLQRKLGNLSEREFSVYSELLTSITWTLKPIDQLIYLHCPAPVSVERIRKRGRPFETTVDERYVTGVANEYEEWLKSVEKTIRVLRVDTSGTIDIPRLAQEIAT